MIAAFVGADHRNWDAHLHEFRHAVNTATQSTTRVSPAFLNFGRNPRPVKSLRREFEGERPVIGVARINLEASNSDHGGGRAPPAAAEESRRAELELEEYLLADSPRAPPVVVNERMEVGEENWDSDQEARRATPAHVPVVDASPPGRLSKSARRRARRYNPRRQLTVDDYVPRHLSPAPSEGLPGPPVSHRGRREQTPPRVNRQDARNREPPSVDEGRAAVPAAARVQPRIRTTGIMFGGLRPVPNDPALDPPPFACWNCWGLNHVHNNCPSLRRVFCYNCGRRGVDLSVCPRCSEPHREFVRRTYAHERALEEELDRRNREAVRREQQQREEQARRRLLARQDARAELERRRREQALEDQRIVEAERHRREAALILEDQRRAEQQWRRAQNETAARATRAVSLAETLRLVEELRELPLGTRDAVLRAIFDDERPR